MRASSFFVQRMATVSGPAARGEAVAGEEPAPQGRRRDSVAVVPHRSHILVAHRRTMSVYLTARLAASASAMLARRPLHAPGRSRPVPVGRQVSTDTAQRPGAVLGTRPIDGLIAGELTPGAVVRVGSFTACRLRVCDLRSHAIRRSLPPQERI